MATPLRTKPCTFPLCEGRMVLSTDDVAVELSIGNAGAPLQPEAARFWECDTDRSHVERPSHDDIRA